MQILLFKQVVRAKKVAWLEWLGLFVWLGVGAACSHHMGDVSEPVRVEQVGSPSQQSRSASSDINGIAVVALKALPTQAQQVFERIATGGPFAYDKDGDVFGNREKILPKAKRGYYREYTVKTPGERDRGARRIVCGGEVVTVPDACYYTADHYNSFQRIVP